MNDDESQQDAVTEDPDAKAEAPPLLNMTSDGIVLYPHLEVRPAKNEQQLTWGVTFIIRDSDGNAIGGVVVADPAGLIQTGNLVNGIATALAQAHRNTLLKPGEPGFNQPPHLRMN